LYNEPAKTNPRYFFWSGNGSPKSVVANWQRSYRRLFALANITKPDGSVFVNYGAVGSRIKAGVPLSLDP
jgi:hypothetical protein